jgi:hypothetical protein
MGRNAWAVVLGVVFFLPLSFSAGRAAECLLSENFDNKVLDSRLVVYNKNWAVMKPPQYRLDAVGRNGTGRCFSSGTVGEAYPCWMRNTTAPWPTDELYVSCWMRYPKFVLTDPANENIKFFYPHWDGTASYVHFAMTGPSTVYYSAMAKGAMVAYSRWLTCPGMTDGKWHHYQFYVKFSEGLSRFWYDGALMVDDAYGAGKWSNLVYYISAPSIDADDPGIFSRQIDDLEIWDGLP